jgi:NADH:ubiquinone oxidoreductase subunit 6 (subunit J)
MVFGVMLTNRIYDMRILAERVNFKRSVVVVGIGFALLTGIMVKTPWNVAEGGATTVSSTAGIGSLLMTSYLLPFEVVAMLLLAALIGASMLASGSEGDEEGEGEA